MHAHLQAILAFLRPIAGVEILGCFDLGIGRQTYKAVRYRQTIQVLPGCPAYERGERTYLEERMLVSGALPASYVRNPGSMSRLGRHYVFDGDEAEWFVVGYVQDVERLTPEQRTHHPLLVDGRVLPTFYLGQWSNETCHERAKITKGRAARIQDQAPHCGGAVR